MGTINEEGCGTEGESIRAAFVTTLFHHMQWISKTMNANKDKQNRV